MIYIFSELHENFKVHVFRHIELVNVRVKKLVKDVLLDKTRFELTYLTSEIVTHAQNSHVVDPVMQNKFIKGASSFEEAKGERNEYKGKGFD